MPTKRKTYLDGLVKAHQIGVSPLPPGRGRNDKVANGVSSIMHLIIEEIHMEILKEDPKFYERKR